MFDKAVQSGQIKHKGAGTVFDLTPCLACRSAGLSSYRLSISLILHRGWAELVDHSAAFKAPFRFSTSPKHYERDLLCAFRHTP